MEIGQDTTMSGVFIHFFSLLHSIPDFFLTQQKARISNNFPTLKRLATECEDFICTTLEKRDVSPNLLIT